MSHHFYPLRSLVFVFFLLSSYLGRSQILNYTVTRETNITYTSIPVSSPALTWAGGGSLDDDCTTPISLSGTTFTYAGQEVSRLIITTNGIVTFSPVGLDFRQFNNNLGPLYTHVVAPFFEDLIVPDGSTLANNIRYNVSGALGSGNAVITVEWLNMATYRNLGPMLSFQLKLYEDGNRIEFIYGVAQGFNGTVGVGGAYNYSYSVGLSGPVVSPLPTSGQVLGQQYENTTVFGFDGFVVANKGNNRLTKMPECYSKLIFTPGAPIVGVVPASIPVNDEPENAINLTPLSCTPLNRCNTYYNSFNATPTVRSGLAATCAGTNPDDDVWFKFTSTGTSATINVYPQGGYDAVFQVLDATLTTSIFCQDTTGEGRREARTLAGLTAGADYYIRVYHKNGGTQATATATISTAGVVTGLSLSNPGSGYMNGSYGGANITASPIVRIVGGGGANAIATVNTTGTNATPAPISGITLDNGGSGYTSAPTVVIAPPGAGISGDFAIDVQQIVSTVANNNVANAITLATDGSQQGPFTLSTATVETGEPVPPVGTSCITRDGWCPGEPGTSRITNTVWFKFTAPSNLIRIQSIYDCGASANNQLALYSATSQAAILTGGATFIAGNDDQTGSNLTAIIPYACVTQGQVYYLQMDGYNGAVGNFRIAVSSVTSSAGIYPAQCSNSPAVTLAGTPVGGTFSGTGVSGTTFTPANASVGSNTITYTLGTGCTAQTTIAVNQGNALSSVTSTSTQTIGSGSTDYIFNCGLIATVLPSGGSTAVSGSIVSRVNVDATQNSYRGQPYVRRHYDISPSTNPNTATATITLYFLQSEFDSYNAAVTAPSLKLPANPTDNTGRGNLRVTQYHGTSGAFTPGTYGGWSGVGPANVLINPGVSGVVWNGTRSRWEVTFNVVGFSGFYITGFLPTPLPLKLEPLAASSYGTSNKLSWNTLMETTTTKFHVERAADGKAYAAIGVSEGRGAAANYTYYDTKPLYGINYYRLKVEEVDGSSFYSNTAVVSSRTNGTITLSPVPAENVVTITCTEEAMIGSSVSVWDMQGREVSRFTLQSIQDLNISAWASGIYSLKIPDGEVLKIVKK